MFELTDHQRNERMLRTQLRDLCASARRDAVLFAILTVLLTPLAIVAFIFTSLFALAFVDLPVIDHLGYKSSFMTGVNLCLAFMGASYFLRPKERYRQRADDSGWLIAAAVMFGVILALSYLTHLVATHPAWFWSLYVALALGMLGCVGHAYEPHDDYYLGWMFGPVLIDNPFSVEDDIDRAHIGLGFVVSISHLILDSYGAILGSRWLWNGLQEPEMAALVVVLQGLASRDPAGVRACLGELGKSSAANCIRALVKLELIVVEKGFPKLTMKGREFLAVRC